MSAVSPPLARLLYRSMLRASGRGRRPECLPMPEGLQTLPQDRSDVVRALRQHFEPGDSPASSIDPFAALRSSTSMFRALWPESLPDELPAFVLPGHTLLPGEHASFVFFEPRYRRMCELATGLRSDTPGDGRFVHLASRRLKSDEPPIGTLVSIMNYERLDDGRYVAEVLAGPRVEATAQRDEEMPRGEPLLHTSLAPYADESPSPPPSPGAAAQQEVAGDGSSEAEALLARCSELLCALPAVQQQGLAETFGAQSRGLTHYPPVLDPERFGLWLCAVLLPPQALQQRLECLHQRSSVERLKFAQQILEGSLALTASKRDGARAVEK